MQAVKLPRHKVHHNTTGPRQGADDTLPIFQNRVSPKVKQSKLHQLTRLLDGSPTGLLQVFHYVFEDSFHENRRAEDNPRRLLGVFNKLVLPIDR